MSRELFMTRINKGFYKATDIQADTGPYSLEDQQIQDIPVENVYAWVKTGAWKQKHFKKWLKAMRVIE